jgi:hypothetical protein
VITYVHVLILFILTSNRTRWQKTIERAANLPNLKLAVRSQSTDSPCVSGLRSVCWKVSQPSHWFCHSSLTLIPGLSTISYY